DACFVRETALGQDVVGEPRRDVHRERHFALPAKGSTPGERRERAEAERRRCEGVGRLGGEHGGQSVACCGAREERGKSAECAGYISAHGATGEVRPLGRRRGGAPRTASHFL